MRNVLFPPTIDLPATKKGKDGRDEPAVLEYTLPQFVREWILSDMRWTDDWSAGFDPMIAKFPLVGASSARLTETEYERSMKSLKDCAMTPQLRVAIMKFWHAFSKAEEVEDCAPPPSPNCAPPVLTDAAQS
jgi:hypothetical protein